jgi:hypothetical protein
MSTNYTFLIASDDYSDFSISDGQNVSNAKIVCFSAGWQQYYWNTPAQTSAPIWLEAGRRYFVRTRHQV